MPKKKKMQVAAARIEQHIYIVRGQRVILDADLAELYAIPTKQLNRAVLRNRERFPDDFMFQLDDEEFENLRCQFGTSSQWGGRRYPPYAFTEHGAIMAANVVRSKEAVQMSLYVVRVFIKLREMMASNQKLAAQFAELERQVEKHDKALVSVVQAIKQLLEPPKPKKKRSMGFISE